MNDKLFGFKLTRFLRTADWKIFDVKTDLQVEERKFCQADNSLLKTICTLVSEKGENTIRVGFCENCGYIGYIDCPTKNWIRKFYFDKWDSADAKDINVEVAKLKKKFFAQDDANMDPLNKFKILDEKFHFNKSRSALDLGCGYGNKLGFLHKIGFKSVVGIENSSHRAEIARRVFGFPIINFPFEEDGAQTELKKYAPFSLIYSKHVLEHTYDPDEIIKLCSLLQLPGDHLMLSLPNVEGESSLLTLLYFPHLHGFSKESIKLLLSNNKYEVVDNRWTDSNENYVLARKVEQINKEIKFSGQNYKEFLMEKFKNTLGIGRFYPNSKRLLWCARKKDGGGQIKGGLINRAIFHYKNRDRKIVTALVQGLEKRYTFFDDSPIEIQFEGNIKLAYK